MRRLVSLCAVVCLVASSALVGAMRVTPSSKEQRQEFDTQQVASTSGMHSVHSMHMSDMDISVDMHSGVSVGVSVGESVDGENSLEYEVESGVGSGEESGAGRTCLIVYHVGKSGGEMLHHWFLNQGLKLWTHYGRGDSDIFQLPSDRFLKGTSPLFIHEADVIMGHFRPYSKQGSFLDILAANNVIMDNVNCYQWTVLRDPLDRAYSLVKYLHPMAPYVDGENEQEYGDNVLSYQAHQIRLVEEVYNHSLAVMFGTGYHWNLYYDPAAQVLTTVDDVSLTEDVKNNMLRLDGVGFLHEIEFCFLAWQKMFLLPSSDVNVFKRNELNVNPRGDSFDSLSADFQKAIIISNPYDMILFKWALQMWKQFTQFGYAAQILLDMPI